MQKKKKKEEENTHTHTKTNRHLDGQDQLGNLYLPGKK